MSETFDCPNCGQPGIVASSHSHFSRGWPANCRICGALAYDQPPGVISAFVFAPEFTSVPLVFLLWAFFSRTVTMVAVFGIVLFAAYDWCRRNRQRTGSRFRPISAESSRLSRRLTYLAILAATAGFGLVSVLIQRHQP
jgi:hypothetical protein